MRMSGQLTPIEDIPPHDRLQAWLLPIADAVMVLMVSRPPGGSLRTARVTKVTIWLALLTLVVLGVASGWLMEAAVTGGKWILVLPAATGLGLSAGCGILALFGIRQRPPGR
jgi:tellurite resistance protein TehA-like permease